jgi:hypothetical protein
MARASLRISSSNFPHQTIPEWIKEIKNFRTSTGVFPTLRTFSDKERGSTITFWEVPQRYLRVEFRLRRLGLLLLRGEEVRQKQVRVQARIIQVTTKARGIGQPERGNLQIQVC